MSVTQYDLGLVKGAPGADGEQIYDVIVRTQAEFEALIASSMWLNAKSVALIGQFTLSTTDNSGVKIPATVKQIHGYNGAKITITNFLYNETTAKGGLWYDSLPTGSGYEIKNLEVDCTNPTFMSWVYGFNNCTQLTNCAGTSAGVLSPASAGFYNCTQLSNCTGTGTGGYKGCGFADCTQLSDCTGTGTEGVNLSAGFADCTQLSNCTGTGVYGNGAACGFNNCTQLTNCVGAGIGEGGAVGYSFCDCNYANGCKSGSTPSITGIWGGTNTHIDADSCEMDS